MESYSVLSVHNDLKVSSNLKIAPLFDLERPYRGRIQPFLTCETQCSRLVDIWRERGSGRERTGKKYAEREKDRERERGEGENSTEEQQRRETERESESEERGRERQGKRQSK